MAASTTGEPETAPSGVNPCDGALFVNLPAENEPQCWDNQVGYTVNELLCFISNKMDVMTQDLLVKLCTDFYGKGVIDNAKKLVYAKCNALNLDIALPRFVKRQGPKKKQSDVLDIIGLCHEVGSKLPVFVARDLSNLPPVSANSFDVASLMRDIEDMKLQLLGLADMSRLSREINNAVNSITKVRPVERERAPAEVDQFSIDVGSHPSDETCRSIDVDSRPSEKTCRVIDVGSRSSDKTGRVIDVGSCPSDKACLAVDSRPSDKTDRVIYVDSLPSDNTCRVFDVDSRPSDKTRRVIDVDSCPSVKTRRSTDVDSRPSDKTRRVIYVDSRPSDNTCRVFDVDSHPSDKTGRVIDVDSRPSDKSCRTNDVDSLASDDTRRVIDDHSRPSHQVEDGSPCDVSSAVSTGLTAEEYNRVFVCGSPRVSNSANACRKNQDVDLEPSDTIVVVVNPAAAASGGPKSKSPLESARPARPARTMAEVVADPPEYQYVTRQRSRRVRTSSLVTAETKAQPSSRKVNNSIHIIGSGERRLSGGIQAAPRRGRESRTGGLFVSRLAPSTSASALRRHIKDSCDVTVTCVSIKTKFDSYCSFRVFAEANLERLLTPSVWPSGVLVREFV